MSAPPLPDIPAAPTQPSSTWDRQMLVIQLTLTRELIVSNYAMADAQRAVKETLDQQFAVIQQLLEHILAPGPTPAPPAPDWLGPVADAAEALAQALRNARP